MLKLETFEPTEKNVSKIVDRYKSAELPRMERLYEYYNNQHSIENRVMESGKPNNKLAHDYCRYITDTTSGYFMGINVKISSDNEEYLQVYQDLCRDNFDADENFELAKKASIYGYAVEIIYQNEMGQSRYKRIDPREMILKLVKNGKRSRVEIAEKILEYNKGAGGKELEGLKKRRQAEQELFLRPVTAEKPEKEDDEMVEKSKIIVNGKEVPVRRILKDGTNFIAVRDAGDALGYAVSAKGNIPVLNKK